MRRGLHPSMLASCAALLAMPSLAMAAGANGTTQALKYLILAKPNYGVQEATMNSLPSGHTTFAAAAGAALSPLWYSRESRLPRPPATAPAAAPATAPATLLEAGA